MREQEGTSGDFDVFLPSGGFSSPRLGSHSRFCSKRTPGETRTSCAGGASQFSATGTVSGPRDRQRKMEDGKPVPSKGGAGASSAVPGHCQIFVFSLPLVGSVLATRRGCFEGWRSRFVLRDRASTTTSFWSAGSAQDTSRRPRSGNKHVLLNKAVPLKLRLKLFNAAVTPTAVFGVATTALTQQQRDRIASTRMQMLRKIVCFNKLPAESWEDGGRRCKEKVRHALSILDVPDWVVCIDHEG